MARSTMPKGLEALFGKKGTPVGAPTSLPIDQLEPNPFQPRRAVGEKDIEELVESVRREGVIQPIVVTSRGPRNFIVAGERRWHAARKAGLREVPIIHRDATDEQMLICALAENVQRRDLSAVEEAKAYARLHDEFSLPFEQVSGMVGKSRSHVSNLVRLLDLPQSVQEMIHQGLLTPGHGKVLVGLNDQVVADELARNAVRQRMSVRELEDALRRMTRGLGRKGKEAEARVRPDAVSRLAAEMSEKLGRRVWITVTGKGKNQKGRICVAFHSPDDFKNVQEALLKHLKA